MPGTEDVLKEVEQLVATNRTKTAEEKLHYLLDAMGSHEVSVWEYDIRNIIDQFLPKRRRNLILFLDERLGKTIKDAADDEPSEDNTVKLLEVRNDFRYALEQLSASHIFQWSTFYRDCFANFFERFMALASDASADETNALITGEISSHAEDIFTKGFRYISVRGSSEPFVLQKSLTGLQRFLELPIEFYSAKLSSYPDPKSSRKLRTIGSAFITGILEGYGRVFFGKQPGWQILPRFPRTWAHYLAFLTRSQIETLMEKIEPGSFREGVERSVYPLVNSIDYLGSQAIDYVPLPNLGQFVWDHRRLDVSLRPPPDAEEPQLIEIQCYLDPAFVFLPALLEAANRGVSLVMAPLRPDLQDLTSKNVALSKIIIGTEKALDSPAAMDKKAIHALEALIYIRRSKRSKSAPINYNFAREFPLHNPFLTKYFHVYRHSVRDLLRTFERRNGVRLWCSVRRSGKTTACFDLGTTTGTSTIISQTCDSTGQFSESNSFYESISLAIAEGKAIPRSFFRDTVTKAAPGRVGETDRFVFVLDEYETLFGRLKSAVNKEPDLRYTIVQPLLNQMVAFTRDNLLVFMGQQPNAHFILMDQNQLSAYVEQDSFPLFQHTAGTTSGEFAELISKVLTDRVGFDSGFTDAVYGETAGHPFLTVKVLVSLVDWLIELQRPSRFLKLINDDFVQFSTERLGVRPICISREYDFFREAVSEGLSDFGRSQNPWLHSVYKTLRRIAQDSPVSLCCTQGDFINIVKEFSIEALGLTGDQILRTGSQANFFEFDKDTVKIKIPILGRIAAAATPRIFS